MPSAASRLKEIRKFRAMSQKAFAEMINVPLRSYQYYESGERPFSAELLIGLSQMGINITWLWTGEGEMNAPVLEEYRRMAALVKHWEMNTKLLEANLKVVKHRLEAKLGQEMVDEILSDLMPDSRYPEPEQAREPLKKVADK